VAEKKKTAVALFFDRQTFNFQKIFLSGGHRLRHHIRRSWVRISPRCKGFVTLCTYTLHALFTEAVEILNAVPKYARTKNRSQCYHHYFLRFFPIFGDKIGVFLKYQCYDQLFSKFSFVSSQKRQSFRNIFRAAGENILKIITSAPGVNVIININGCSNHFIFRRTNFLKIIVAFIFYT
jgi:hypothetical protein